MRIPGYVLAGGSSARFGRDKAREAVRGRPLVRHAADLVAVVASPVLVVAARAGEYRDLGLLTLGDDHRGLGPLGGLARALRHACDEPTGAAPLVLVAPCDWLGARAEWMRALLAAWRPGDRAVAYRGRWWDPLPGLFATSLLDTVREALDSDDRSLHALLDHVDARALPRPPDWSRAVRVNRPEDLARCGLSA